MKWLVGGREERRVKGRKEWGEGKRDERGLLFMPFQTKCKGASQPSVGCGHPTPPEGYHPKTAITK